MVYIKHSANKRSNEKWCVSDDQKTSCKHNGDDSICIGCAIFVGNGNLPIKFE